VRAAVVEALGRPPAAAEVPQPRRRPGEALVRIRAAALNPVELHIWNGHFFDGPPRPPYVIGLEGVGVVEEGERLAPGTRVRVEFVHPGYGRDGAAGEYAVVPEEPDASDRASQASVAPIGDELDDTAAAAQGVPVFTALMCLERAEAAGARLEGAHVLVTAATGAVGIVAVQLAKLMGADLRDRFAEAGGGRLDVALDPLWGEPARAAIDALSRGGVYVSFGQAAAPVAELSGIPLRNRRVTLVGHSGAWATPQERQAALARAHELAASAGRPLVLDTEEVALDEIGDAWERLSKSAGRRLVVRP
jgi:NADPH:quinone reductase-like Zn-dependent oxidoreductase